MKNRIFPFSFPKIRLLRTATTLEEEESSDEEKRKSSKEENGEEEEKKERASENKENEDQAAVGSGEGEVFLLENLGYRGYREDVLKDRLDFVFFCPLFVSSARFVTKKAKSQEKE